jgi:hypothetical protein
MEVFVNDSIRALVNELDFLSSEGSFVLQLEWTTDMVFYVTIRTESPEFVFSISRQSGDMVSSETKQLQFTKQLNMLERKFS